MIDEDSSLATRHMTKRAKPDDIRGIVISPTRELAEQIGKEAMELTRHTGLVVQVAVGGQHKGSMLRDIQRRGCHLLIATPGRLKDILEDPSSRVEAPNLAALVLDEADRMLDVGFADALEDIQRLLPDVKEKPRQTMLFSATIPRNVIGLARSMVRQDQFDFVQTIRHDEAPTHEKIPQKIVILPSQVNLFPALYELLDREVAKSKETGQPFKAIIYYSTTTMVELAHKVHSTMRRSRPNDIKYPFTYFIHGQLSQRNRTHAADSFRRAQSAILISSDVTARGMDFPNVTHVIQVGRPVSREQYIHRLGRTGRQGKDGEGWLLIPAHEAEDTRRSLGDLDLVRDTSLESSQTLIESEEAGMPQIFEDVRSAFEHVDEQTLTDAYTSKFGHMPRCDAQDFVDDTNKWIKLIWGWPEPPRVSQQWVIKRGLRNVQGFNVGPQNHSPGNMRRPPVNSRRTFENRFERVMHENRHTDSTGHSGHQHRRRPRW